MRDLVHKPNRAKPSTTRTKTSAKSTPSGTTAAFRHSPGHEFGRVPLRYTPPAVLQTKLMVNTIGDSLEQEAERTADTIRPLVDTTPAGDRHEKKNPTQTIRTLQAAGAGRPADPEVEQHLQDTQGLGQPLPSTVRAGFESQLGSDFSRVRVHADRDADSLNRKLGARAFTSGSDIYFRHGELNPDTVAGQHLLAHELTHVLQQGPGAAQRGIQRQEDLATQIRTEADLPAGKQTKGRLQNLEIRAGREADEAFQRDIGAGPLQEGAAGTATRIIRDIIDDLTQVENARRDGYGDAVTAIVAEETLNSPKVAEFWAGFAGNMISALAGLVPALAPLIATEFFLPAGAGLWVMKMVKPSPLKDFLTAANGSLASSLVDVAGTVISQFSAGVPSGSALPKTLSQIKSRFDELNAAVIRRARSEVTALTLNVLNNVPEWIAPNGKMTAALLEDFTKRSLKTVFFDPAILMGSYQIDTAATVALAKNALLNAFILQYGTINDVPFSSTDEVGDRRGATGTGAALNALGGQEAFAKGLRGDYELVVGNLNGMLVEWGGLNLWPAAAQEAQSTGKELAEGIHVIPFKIVNVPQFTARLNEFDYEPLTPGARQLEVLHGRGGAWKPNVIPARGAAVFSPEDYSSLTIGKRTIYALKSVTLIFSPSGSFDTGPLNERSSIEPGTQGQIAKISFSGKLEQIKVPISRDAWF
jgi:hypothetical protein